MSLPLSAEEIKQYTDIIDGILKSADLQTVTRKKIRVELEDELGGKDLGKQKNAIKRLIEDRFDAISTGDPTTAAAIPPSSHPDASASPKRQTNGGHPLDEDDGYTSDGAAAAAAAADDDDDDDDEVNASGEIEVSTEPAKKKQKRGHSLDADAKLAAELQAMENRLARGRTTRGGGASTTKKAVKKKAPKKKSAHKVKEEDDSDLGSGESGTRKRKAGGGFQKPFNLSSQLAILVGEPQLSRPQVVKQLWKHIKAHDLQNPKDKREIICDEKMQAVFKQARVDMFQMNKLIGSHLYPIDE